jgi:hypothetical protein
VDVTEVSRTISTLLVGGVGISSSTCSSTRSCCFCCGSELSTFDGTTSSSFSSSGEGEELDIDDVFVSVIITVVVLLLVSSPFSTSNADFVVIRTATEDVDEDKDDAEVFDAAGTSSSTVFILFLSILFSFNSIC